MDLWIRTPRIASILSLFWAWVMIEKICEGLYQYRVSLFVLGVIALIGMGSQIPRLAVTGDFKVLFSDENPYLQRANAIDEQFLTADSIVFLLEPSGSSIYTRDNLEMIEWFTDEAWQLPYSIRVDSLTNFQRTNADEDSITVDYFITDAADLSDEDVAERKAYATKSKILSNAFTNNEGNASALQVTLAMPEGDRIDLLKELAVASRALAERAEQKYPGLKVYLSGDVFLENAFVEIIGHDLREIIPIVLFVCCFIVALLLRSVAAVICTLVIILFSVTFTMGAAALAGVVLTTTSVMAPLMVIVLALADAIHLITQFIIQLRSGYSKDQAIIKSLQMNIRPIFLTSVTTAIGFLGMNFSASPAFHDFGNIAAGGVMVAYLFSMTIFPAMMSWLPVSKRAPLELVNAMDWLANYTVRSSYQILIFTGIAMAAVIMFIPNNELNDEVIDYFDESTEFRQALEFGNEHLSGVQYIAYAMETNEEGGINNPEFLTKMDQFSEWYRQQPGVVNVTSYADILKNLNKAMHGDDEKWHKVPEKRELASQYFLLYEMGLPQGFDIGRDIDEDRSAMRLVVSLNQMDNNTLVNLEKRADQWLLENAPEYRSNGSSRALMFSSLGEMVTKSMISGSIFAFICITLTLLIGLRSIKYGLISIIPNIFPAAIVFGLWGILIQEVNMVASMMFSISLGLVVDDTVHFLSKYIDEKRRSGDAKEAVRYAFRTAGSALVVTTVALTFGLSALMLSDFGPSVTTIKMLCPIIVVALALDLLFLPSLLIVIEQLTNRKKEAALETEVEPETNAKAA